MLSTPKQARMPEKWRDEQAPSLPISSRTRAGMPEALKGTGGRHTSCKIVENQKKNLCLIEEM